MIKKAIIPLLALFLLSFCALNIMVVNADSGSVTFIISNPTGGHTSPGPGTYFYQAQVANFELYAYPDPGYSLIGWNMTWIDTGWIWYTGENPLTASLNVGADNITVWYNPVFSPNPYYAINMSSANSVWVDLNNIAAQCLTSGSGDLYIFPGNTYVTVHYPESTQYHFNNFLINGSTLITVPSYSFYIRGDTDIFVNETYTPPTNPPGAGTGINVFYYAIGPSVVVGVLGMAFSTLGKEIDGHNYAGFLIGGCIGLIMCTQVGIIPVWLTTVILALGFISVYFWFKSGE